MTDLDVAHQAEVSCLGSVFLNNNSLGRSSDYVKAEDFRDPRHRVIWAGMLSLESAGLPIDVVTLSARFEGQGTVGQAGGVDYLFALTQASATASNVEHHARIVARCSQLRRVKAAMDRLSSLAAGSGPDEVDDVLGDVWASVDQLTDRATPGESVMTQTEAAKQLFLQLHAISEGKAPPTTPFGRNMEPLTNITGGGADPTCELVIIGASSGLGKTALATQLADEIAAEGRGTVAYFSVEVSGVKIELRNVSRRMGIPAQHIKMMSPGNIKGLTGTAEDEAFEDLNKMQNRVVQAITIDRDRADSVTVYHKAGMTAAYIGRKVRSLCRVAKVAAVFVDYWQALKAEGQHFNRDAELGSIAESLKAIQIENQVPMYVAAQLNRNPANRPGYVPMTHDLRESSTLEHWASLILLLNRVGFYDPSAVEADGTEPAEVYVRKNREGPTGVVRLNHRADCGRFWPEGENWRHMDPPRKART